MKDPEKIMNGEEAMGFFGRITSLKNLPKDSIIKAYIKEAMVLNEKGIKLPSRKKTELKEVLVPAYFMKALRSDNKALTTFNGFSPSQKKEYVTWITEAKSEETRKRRLEKALEWMAEGKIRNWKYVRR